MLKLRKQGRPPAVLVALGGDAVAYVRPARAFEFDLAVLRARDLLAGIDQSEGAGTPNEGLQLIFGDDAAQHEGGVRDEHWRSIAAERLGLIELGVQCIERWENVADEHGAEVPITREALAMVLADTKRTSAIRAVLNASPHHESETNG